MAAINKKFVILQQVNVMLLLLLQILAAIENFFNIQEWVLANSWKHFIRLISLSTLSIWNVFVKSPNSRVRSIKFLFRVGKNVDYMENLEFSLRVEISSRVSWTELKHQLGIPSWNIISVYGAEIFTCNCNVNRFNELKFQPGLKISI